MNLFRIQQKTQVPDGIGGFSEAWDDMPDVSGYLDMLTGTDLNSVQNAFIEQSTHVLIIPEYTEWITDQMRIVDMDGRYYEITYSDNPVGVNHHNEVYCKFGGVISGY